MFTVNPNSGTEPAPPAAPCRYAGFRGDGSVNALDVSVVLNPGLGPEIPADPDFTNWPSTASLRRAFWDHILDSTPVYGTLAAEESHRNQFKNTAQEPYDDTPCCT